MRDYKTVGIRLNAWEAKTIEKLAKDQEVTVSALVRLWLEKAYKEAHKAGYR